MPASKAPTRRRPIMCAVVEKACLSVPSVMIIWTCSFFIFLHYSNFFITPFLPTFTHVKHTIMLYLIALLKSACITSFLVLSTFREMVLFICNNSCFGIAYLLPSCEYRKCFGILLKSVIILFIIMSWMYPNTTSDVMQQPSWHANKIDRERSAERKPSWGRIEITLTIRIIRLSLPHSASLPYANTDLTTDRPVC